jgi:two-component system alkaline phosphatase synthesis response regulator PhoP
MDRPSILIVEDDPDIVELLRFNLERERYLIHISRSGEEGIESARSRKPALVILDLGLPGIPGLEVCRILKQEALTRPIPIIMLTARGEESDIVLGLEFGADDYITKPFKVREFIARVRAVLRRSSPKEQETGRSGPIVSGPLELDSERHEARLEGDVLPLTPTEFRLLRALAARPGRVLTRDQLLTGITDGSTFITDRNVDVHVRSLRKKLGESRNLIITVRGVGYKFRDSLKKEKE